MSLYHVPMQELIVVKTFAYYGLAQNPSSNVSAPDKGISF